jgi:hypothetical protein
LDGPQTLGCSRETMMDISRVVEQLLALLKDLAEMSGIGLRIEEFQYLGRVRSRILDCKKRSKDGYGILDTTMASPTKPVDEWPKPLSSLFMSWVKERTRVVLLAPKRSGGNDQEAPETMALKAIGCWLSRPIALAASVFGIALAVLVFGIALAALVFGIVLAREELLGRTALLANLLSDTSLEMIFVVSFAIFLTSLAASLSCHRPLPVYVDLSSYKGKNGADMVEFLREGLENDDWQALWRAFSKSAKWRGLSTVRLVWLLDESKKSGASAIIPWLKTLRDPVRDFPHSLSDGVMGTLRIPFLNSAVICVCRKPRDQTPAQIYGKELRVIDPDDETINVKGVFKSASSGGLEILPLMANLGGGSLSSCSGAQASTAAYRDSLPSGDFWKDSFQLFSGLLGLPCHWAWLTLGAVSALSCLLASPTLGLATPVWAALSIPDWLLEEVFAAASASLVASLIFSFFKQTACCDLRGFRKRGILSKLRTDLAAAYFSFRTGKPSDPSPASAGLPALFAIAKALAREGNGAGSILPWQRRLLFDAPATIACAQIDGRGKLSADKEHLGARLKAILDYEHGQRTVRVVLADKPKDVLEVLRGLGSKPDKTRGWRLVCSTEKIEFLFCRNLDDMLLRRWNWWFLSARLCAFAVIVFFAILWLD